MLPWLYYILLLAILAGGLFLVILTLPGLWLMTAAAAIFGAITHWKFVGGYTIWILLGTSFIAEVLELTLGGAAAKKAGGGRRAMVGGLFGGILGGMFLSVIPIPIISTIVGICLGCFLGAFIMEYTAGEPASHSLRVGVGAAKGRLFGMIIKLVFGAAMFVFIAFRALP
jgi:uncharacterized protein YqgC (DUF456 family)